MAKKATATAGGIGAEEPSVATGHEPLGDLEDLSSAQLRDRLAALDEERGRVEADLAAAEAYEEENLLQVDDAALEANDEEVVRLKRRLARLAKVIELVSTKIVETQQLEEEERRRAAYQRGQELCEEGRRWICETYPALAKQIAAGLMRQAEIDAALRMVNDKRPSEGHWPVLSYEDVRYAPVDNEPRYQTDIYFVDVENHRSAAQSHTVCEKPEGSGQYWFGPEHNLQQVYRREHRRPLPPSPIYRRAALERTVVLPPGPYGDGDYWPRS